MAVIKDNYLFPIYCDNAIPINGEKNFHATGADIVDTIEDCDLFVKKAGDTMTGNLVMDTADIELDNGYLVFEVKGDLAYVTDPNNRFAKIVSRAPKNTSDGTTDTSSAFGIRVELDEGNTFKNQFAVNNRDGDIVKVTSGTGPSVQFGTNFTENKDGWDDPKYEGSVTIKGIPTPAFDNPEPTIAVNKEYVDTRDDLLRQDIIELEQEINAIAPSVEYGTWRWLNAVGANNPPEAGTFFLLDTTTNPGNPTITTKYVETGRIVIHNDEYVHPGDLDPVDTHFWTDAEVGDLIQLFDAADPDFLLGKITAKDTSNADFVYIDVELIQTSGAPNDNKDQTTQQYLTRINIFEKPTGGDASEFVKKIGDEMTGALKFTNDQDSSNYDSNAAKAKITFVNTTSGGNTKTSHIYQAGDLNALVTNADFKTKANIYTNSYIYGWDKNSGVTYNPRIYFFSNSSSYLSFGSTSQLRWGSGGLKALVSFTCDIGETLSSAQNSFVIKGRVKDGNSSNLKYDNLLKDYRRHSGSPSSDYIAYYGDNGGDYEIANKKYVDSKVGGPYVNSSGGPITITKSGSNYYIT